MLKFWGEIFFFFFFFWCGPFKKIFYLFIFGCSGPLLLLELFCSCGKWQLSSCCAGFSSGGLLSLWGLGSIDVWASVAAAPGLWSAGSVVVVHRLICPTACGITWARDGPHVSCIGMWILYHRATREASRVCF